MAGRRRDPKNRKKTGKASSRGTNSSNRDFYIVEDYNLRYARWLPPTPPNRISEMQMKIVDISNKVESDVENYSSDIEANDDGKGEQSKPRRTRQSRRQRSRSPAPRRRRAQSSSISYNNNNNNKSNNVVRRRSKSKIVKNRNKDEEEANTRELRIFKSTPSSKVMFSSGVEVRMIPHKVMANQLWWHSDVGFIDLITSNRK